MALTIFITGVIIVLIALAYDYYFGTKGNSTNSEVNNLRGQILALKQKLQQPVEDTVTHLLSWTTFEDRINHAIKESERYGFIIGVLFIDIDEFRIINEALGREVGDRLLNEVAKKLGECLRQVDSISRFSKDTFGILLAKLAKPESAAIIAQRILLSLAQPFQIDEHEIYVTVCIGISLYPNDGQDTQALLRNADQALYRAKEKGKHLCQFYEESMHIQSQRDLVIYNSLSRESIFKELLVYFQPVMNLSTGSVFCMDALLQWQNLELGLVDTSELNEHAERQRKLNAISGWLLKSACKQYLAWLSAGFKSSYLGITLSTTQLDNGHFVHQLSSILQELAFNPEWLLIEIKESNLNGTFEKIEKAFNMLAYLGINIGIDQFGSTSFPLRYLKNLHIDYIKLDSELIVDLIENEQTRALVKSILFLAETMSIRVIASGVEDEAQLTALKALGCGLAQGSLWGVPRLASDVTNTMTVHTI